MYQVSINNSHCYNNKRYFPMDWHFSLFTENESPRITGNDSINVEVGKTVYMQFNASDDSNKLPKYNVLKQPESFTLNNTTGIASWTPNDINVTELRYFKFTSQM